MTTKPLTNGKTTAETNTETNADTGPRTAMGAGMKAALPLMAMLLALPWIPTPAAAAGAAGETSLAATSGGAQVAQGAPVDTLAATASDTEGEVRKVDPGAGKLTIRHGPIANLEMSAMTMVFRVKDPAMLGQVRPGDHIRFTAERVDGALTVTSLSVAR